MALRVLKLTTGFAIFALTFTPLSAFAIQGRGNSKVLCQSPHVDAESQGQNFSVFLCQAELVELRCDEFFKTDEELDEFKRQCPPSKKERQINGGDLGAVCLGQMLNPTIASIKAVAAFIAAGMKESAENQQQFIADCKASPDFKAKILSTIRDLATLSKEQSAQYSCEQLAGDFQNNQNDYQVNDRAEAAYKKYIGTPHNDSEAVIGKNPISAFLEYDSDRWRCLNQAGHYAIRCSEFFSIIDPTLLIGGAGAISKGLKLAKLFKKATVGKSIGKLAHLDSVPPIPRSIATPVVKPNLRSLSPDVMKNLELADSERLAQLISLTDGNEPASQALMKAHASDPASGNLGFIGSKKKLDLAIAELEKLASLELKQKN